MIRKKPAWCHAGAQAPSPHTYNTPEIERKDTVERKLGVDTKSTWEATAAVASV